jgi:kumamolisin
LARQAGVVHQEVQVMSKHPLKGSERRLMAGASVAGPANPDERLEVSVLLRRSDAAGLEAHVRRLHAGESVAHLSREAFEARFGASPDDIKAVRSFAASHGLSVTRTHVGSRTVWLSGTVAQFGAAFGGSYRGRTGAIHLPDELHGRVDAVLGLDNRPAAHTHFRIRPAAAAGTPSYTPLQIAGFYDFPAGTGTGQCVGIIELGGGETASDLKTYLSGLGIATPPKVVVVPVDGGSNAPTGDPNGPDGEVMLDDCGVGAAGNDCHLFHAKYRCRLYRCHYRRGARHYEQAFSDFHQLGRAGIFVDSAIHNSAGFSAASRRNDGHYGVRRVRR